MYVDRQVPLFGIIKLPMEGLPLLFLEFLSRNNALYRDDIKIISDGALVAITLMIAESNPKEKDIMTALVMNLLKM